MTRARRIVRTTALLTAAILLGAASARAQSPIQDNSFLIEEAYNQERGVVQHISTFARARGTGDWAYTFTQEWPLPDERHQVSYTLPLQERHRAPGTDTGVGDVALNYRYQAAGRGGGRVALSPRATVILPTGRSRDGLGAGGAALQVNLPLSVALSAHVVTHWNAGGTHTFSARSTAGDRANTNAWALGQSVVWLLRPRFNVLVETAWSRAQVVSGAGLTDRSDSLFVSPGIRWAHDFRSGLQIVPGIAVPIGVGPSHGEHALFLYLSFEHPFRAAR